MKLLNLLIFLLLSISFINCQSTSGGIACPSGSNNSTAIPIKMIIAPNSIKKASPLAGMVYGSCCIQTDSSTSITKYTFPSGVNINTIPFGLTNIEFTGKIALDFLSTKFHLEFSSAIINTLPSGSITSIDIKNAILH